LIDKSDYTITIGKRTLILSIVIVVFLTISIVVSAPVISSLAQSQSNQHQGRKQVGRRASPPGTQAGTTTTTSTTTTGRTHHTIQSSHSLFLMMYIIVGRNASTVLIHFPVQLHASMVHAGNYLECICYHAGTNPFSNGQYVEKYPEMQLALISAAALLPA
jgi:hypothetical protein